MESTTEREAEEIWLKLRGRKRKKKRMKWDTKKRERDIERRNKAGEKLKKN